MAKRSNKSPHVSRRVLLGAPVLPLISAETEPGEAAAATFLAWAVERELISQALSAVPEADEPAQARLLDRSYQLERLIIDTPTNALVGVRIKADLLLWYMEMEQADGLAAMRHIRDYLAGRR